MTDENDFASSETSQQQQRDSGSMDRSSARGDAFVDEFLSFFNPENLTEDSEVSTDSVGQSYTSGLQQSPQNNLVPEAVFKKVFTASISNRGVIIKRYNSRSMSTRSSDEMNRLEQATIDSRKRRRLSNGRSATGHNYLPNTAATPIQESSAANHIRSIAQESQGMEERVRDASLPWPVDRSGYPRYTSIWTPD